jgi:hypothetical protein
MSRRLLDPSLETLLERLVRDALQRMCEVARDETVNESAHRAAVAGLREALDQGRVPPDLLPMVNAALVARGVSGS